LYIGVRKGYDQVISTEKALNLQTIQADVVVDSLRKGIISILLYLLTITVSIIVGTQGIIIMGVFWIVATGICFSIGFFMNNYFLKGNPGLRDSFNNPESNIHIIAPISFLVLTLTPQIVWLFWPTFATLMLSGVEPFLTPFVVPMLSIELGGIGSYLRFQVTTDGSTDE
jgi:hypothetical protein